MEPDVTLLRYREMGMLPTFQFFELEYYVEDAENEGWLARSYKADTWNNDLDCSQLTRPEGVEVDSSLLEPIFELIDKSVLPLNPSLVGGIDGSTHRLDIEYLGGTGLTIKWWSDFISEQSILEIRDHITAIVKAS